jgi:hypothetical protein
MGNNSSSSINLRIKHGNWNNLKIPYGGLCRIFIGDQKASILESHLVQRLENIEGQRAIHLCIEKNFHSNLVILFNNYSFCVQQCVGVEPRFCVGDEPHEKLNVRVISLCDIDGRFHAGKLLDDETTKLVKKFMRRITCQETIDCFALLKKIFAIDDIIDIVKYYFSDDVPTLCTCQSNVCQLIKMKEHQYFKAIEIAKKMEKLLYLEYEKLGLLSLSESPFLSEKLEYRLKTGLLYSK